MRNIRYWFGILFLNIAELILPTNDEYGREIFTLLITMKKRWIPTFISFLNAVEYNGRIGRSSTISLYADGDGDFRPRFFGGKTTVDYTYVPPKSAEVIVTEVYDAG